ncbi:MAG: ATP-binding protein, partial [Pseudomonadota bacterium]
KKEYWINTVNWPAYVEVRVAIDDGALIFFPLRKRIYATTGPIFVMWLVGTSLLIGWIAIVFLRNQVCSILRLVGAAEAFGRGRDAPDFRPTGATEVRRAGRAFIAMRERIKRHMRQRTTMLAGVSHDLRTPLTRIKLALAMQPDSEDIVAMRSDVTEMEKMLEAYLDFARDIAADGPQEDIDAVDLAVEIAHETERAGHAITYTPTSEIIFCGRRDAVKRAVTNLVGNGLKYAKRVWLSDERGGVYIEFIVDDDGDGIAEDQYETAFKPFVRLDEARGQNISGVGLGLSVVRDVARSHGGDVLLEKSPKGGLRARLRLPA